MVSQVQRRVGDVHQESDDLLQRKTYLDEARARAARERDRSSSTQTAHYAAASLGQSPYVSLPGIGIMILQKSSWGC